MFASLGLCQHVGVLLFMSSRNLFACKYLITITCCQVINFTIWLSQAMLHWMPIWSQYVFMFLVGSVAGLSYVNAYYMLLNDEGLDAKHRGLGANFTSWTVRMSVLLSSGFSYLAENTFLKPFVPTGD
jgi:hypothetical protein